MIWLSVDRDFFMEPPRESVRENSTSGVSYWAGGLPTLWTWRADQVTQLDHDLPHATIHGGRPTPEGISAGDPGTQLVNYRVRGRFYVVDRIFDVAELRLGTKKQQIVRIQRVVDTVRSRSGS